MRTILLAVAICVAIQPTQASTASDELTRLLLKTRAASDRLARERAADPELDAFDREMVSIQHTRVRLYADCADGLTILAQRPEIDAPTFKVLLNDVRQLETPACRLGLARLALERTSSMLNPIMRLALRFELGAELHALKAPEAKTVMDDAEVKLIAGKEHQALADARFKALTFFLGQPDESAFLERSVVTVKEFMVFDSTRNGFLVIFARAGRCDLVEQVAGPNSCAKWVQTAKDMYSSAPNISWLSQIGDELGLKQVTPDEAGLRNALAGPVPMGKLVLLAKRIRQAMQERSTTEVTKVKPE